VFTVSDHLLAFYFTIYDMIQRIQTIYLFLAGIFVLVTGPLPLVYFDKEEGFYAMTAWSFDGIGVSPFVGTPSMPYGVLFFFIVLVVMLWRNIFSYKNRKKQIRVCNYAIVTYFLYFATIAVYAISFANNAATSNIRPSYSLFCPAIGLLLTFCARNRIKKDEELIRAADRIR